MRVLIYCAPGVYKGEVGCYLPRIDAGWSSPVARQAHNLKVIGSNPIPATKKARYLNEMAGFSILVTGIG